jgi:hypothetical protein
MLGFMNELQLQYNTMEDTRAKNVISIQISFVYFWLWATYLGITRQQTQAYILSGSWLEMHEANMFMFCYSRLCWRTVRHKHQSISTKCISTDCQCLLFSLHVSRYINKKWNVLNQMQFRSGICGGVSVALRPHHINSKRIMMVSPRCDVSEGDRVEIECNFHF